MKTIIKFSAIIETTSMLHIGASGHQGKGRFDKAFVKNNGVPILPGSSFRGVTRHKMAELAGKNENSRVAGLNVHLCTSEPACDVCIAFGVPAQNRSGAGGSRVVFYDGSLTPESAEQLRRDNGGNLTVCHSMALIGENEKKQQEAKKRDIECVPAGALFATQWHYELHEAADIERLCLILAAMQSVQDTDGLGAMGQSGHGKISILDVSAVLITADTFIQQAEPQAVLEAAPIADVVASFNEWSASLSALFQS